MGVTRPAAIWTHELKITPDNSWIPYDIQILCNGLVVDMRRYR